MLHFCRFYHTDFFYIFADTRAELSMNTEIYVKPGSALSLECRCQSQKNTSIYINWQAKSHKYRMLLFCISYLSDNIAFLYLSENIFLYLHENIVILHLSEIFVNKRILFRVLNLGGKVPSYLYWWYNTWHTTCIFIRWIKLFPPVLIERNLHQHSLNQSFCDQRYHDNVVINYGGKATEEVKISTREDFSLSRYLLLLNSFNLRRKKPRSDFLSFFHSLWFLQFNDDSCLKRRNPKIDKQMVQPRMQKRRGCNFGTILLLFWSENLIKTLFCSCPLFLFPACSILCQKERQSKSQFFSLWIPEARAIHSGNYTCAPQVPIPSSHILEIWNRRWLQKQIMFHVQLLKDEGRPLGLIQKCISTGKR